MASPGPTMSTKTRARVRAVYNNRFCSMGRCACRAHTVRLSVHQYIKSILHSTNPSRSAASVAGREVRLERGSRG
eukprot:3997416-Pyramimonas_sp.AAC.1